MVQDGEDHGSSADDAGDGLRRYEEAFTNSRTEHGGIEPTGRTDDEGLSSSNGAIDTQEAVCEIEAIDDKQVDHLIDAVLTQYSGLLPPPDMFSMYPKEAQEHILQYADASTLDESRRQDRLVDAEIKNSHWSLFGSIAMYGISWIIAGVVAVRTRDVGITTLFMLSPLISSGLAFFRSVQSKSSEKPKPKK